MNNSLVLSGDKILDYSNLKTFADNKMDVAEKVQFVVGRVENIVGKGENACYQHFLPFPLNVFKEPLLQGR